MTNALHYAGRNPVRLEFSGGRITALKPADTPVPGPILAPALIDLQVNGHAGLDFKLCQGKSQEIQAAVRHLWSCGTAYFLPTLITAQRGEITASLRTLETVRQGGPEGVSILGYHLEGPYISPEDGYRGAHPQEHCRLPDPEEFNEWWQASGRKIQIVTLAPELAGAIDFIGYLRSLGIRAAIGHSRADHAQVAAAVRAGATLSTHLGNGIPRLLSRHPNPVWEQLARDELWAGIIADGEHLGLSVISVFQKVKSGKLLLVSDASRWAGAAPGDYTFEGRPIRVEEGGRLYFTDNGGLLGSGSYLPQCISHLVRSGLAPEKTAVEMASTRPAAYLGAGDLPSGLRPGQEATFILYQWGTGGAMEVRETWIKGQQVYKKG